MSHSAEMRALRWHHRRDLRLERLPVPRPAPDQALVRVERVGLCGTDVEEYHRGPLDIPVGRPHPRSGQQAPLVTGHEVVGVVEICPSDAARVGQRVVPDVVEGCGTCWWCLRHEDGLCPELVVLGQHGSGGLAEYLLCRSSTMVGVPPDLGPDVAAFAEPAAVAVRAVAKAGDLRGATVVVVGAGVVGNLVAQLVLATGATVGVLDPSEGRRSLALGVRVDFAASSLLEAKIAVGQASAGRRADVVFECAGRPESFADSMTLVRRGGTVVLVGLHESTPPLPWRDVVLSELRILGSAAHVWDIDMVTAVRALALGLVDPRPLLSRVVGLDEVPAVLETLGRPNSLAKVLVDPSRVT